MHASSRLSVVGSTGLGFQMHASSRLSVVGSTGLGFQMHASSYVRGVRDHPVVRNDAGNLNATC
eukprot:1179103-Prorocentrum_minimum.AAC.1